MSTERKSRRRSSLAATKIRTDLPAPSDNELHLQISETLSPEERLEELCKLAIKHAVEKQIASSQSEEEKECLAKVLPDCLDVLYTQEFQDGIWCACQPTSLLPNPVNEQMDQAIAVLDSKIKKLKVEDESWQRYKDQLALEAEEAERRSERRVIFSDELTEEQRSLTANYLPTLLDLKGVKDDVEKAQNITTIMLHEHQQNVQEVEQRFNNIQKETEEVLNQLNDADCPGSPRTTIKRWLDIPTP